MTTGPRVGSSSVAWDTPAGVSTSMALGTVPGSTEHTGLVPSAGQTPNVNPPAGWVNVRAWSGLNPSCPVSTTVKAPARPGRAELGLGQRDGDRLGRVVGDHERG